MHTYETVHLAITLYCFEQDNTLQL